MNTSHFSLCPAFNSELLQNFLLQLPCDYKLQTEIIGVKGMER